MLLTILLHDVEDLEKLEKTNKQTAASNDFQFVAVLCFYYCIQCLVIKKNIFPNNTDLIKIYYISEATIFTHIAIIHWLSTIYCIQSVKGSISPGPAQDGDKPHLLLNTICYCLSISLPLCHKHLKNHTQTTHTALNAVK